MRAYQEGERQKGQVYGHERRHQLPTDEPPDERWPANTTHKRHGSAFTVVRGTPVLMARSKQHERADPNVVLHLSSSWTAVSGTSPRQLRRPHALARGTTFGCASSTAAGSTRVKKPPTDHLKRGGA